MEVLSKQQLRIQETQSRLLDAAEEVFVRDGYEGAQLDEIAAAIAAPIQLHHDYHD